MQHTKKNVMSLWHLVHCVVVIVVVMCNFPCQVSNFLRLCLLIGSQGSVSVLRWSKSRRRKRDTNGKGCEIDLALCLRQCVSHDFFYHSAVLTAIRYASRPTLLLLAFQCVENATRSQCVKNDHLLQTRTLPTLTSLSICSALSTES